MEICKKHNRELSSNGDCRDCGGKPVKPKTKTFELSGLMQDIGRKDKGSKSLKEPHTKFVILTRKINNEEMDELIHGGCKGHSVCLKITVVLDEENEIKQE